MNVLFFAFVVFDVLMLGMLLFVKMTHRFEAREKRRRMPAPTMASLIGGAGAASMAALPKGEGLQAQQLAMHHQLLYQQQLANQQDLNQNQLGNLLANYQSQPPR